MKITIILYNILLVLILSCKQVKESSVPVMPQSTTIIRTVPVDPCTTSPLSQACGAEPDIQKVTTNTEIVSAPNTIPFPVSIMPPVNDEPAVKEDKDIPPVAPLSASLPLKKEEKSNEVPAEGKEVVIPPTNEIPEETTAKKQEETIIIRPQNVPDPKVTAKIPSLPENSTPRTPKTNNDELLTLTASLY
jgi:hypothetical protein